MIFIERIDVMLFGDKTTAIFDIWSLEHFLCGIILSFFIKSTSSELKFNLAVLLLISCFWECLEHYLEEGLLGVTIQNWFSGTEYWANRLIGDNLMIIAGLFTHIRYPKSIYFACILWLMFLLLHLYSTSSMYIQELLF